MSCSVDGCKMKALFICECQKSGEEMCEVHCDFHKNDQPEHKINLIYYHLDPSERYSIISSLLEEYQALLRLKLKLEDIAKIIISYINNSLQKAINPIMREQEKILTTIKDLERVKFAKLPEQEDLFDRDELIIKLNPYSLDYFNLINEVECFYSQDFLKSVQKLNKNSEGFSSCIAYFTRGSEYLSRIDIPSAHAETSNVKIGLVMGGNAGSCLVPDKRVFYYGGQYNSMTFPFDSCVIIDTETNTIDIKKNGPKKLYNIGCCAYFKGKVYLFGGDGKCAAVSDKSYEYDLALDSWRTIANLPVSSDRNCALAVFGGIFVTGFRAGLFHYDIENNIFTEKGVKSEGGKILLPVKRYFVVIHNNKIYKCDGDQVSCVRTVSGFGADVYMKFYPVIYSSWVYFLSSDKNLYRMNRKNYFIERVKLLENNFN